MAYAQYQTVEQMSWENYQAVSEKLGDQAPDGLILHAAGPRGDGFVSVNVWESKEQADKFRENTLLPAIEAVTGYRPQGPSDGEEFEVQHIIKP